MRKWITLGVLFLLPATMALAAGFSLGEFGGRAAAMGNAVTAQAYDASTLFYNPAGLAFLEGTQFYGNLTLISPSAKFVGAEPIYDNTVHDAKKQIFPPIGLYVTHRFHQKFAAGLSVTTPFGLGLAWEDDFPGTVISKDVNLQTYYITPVVSFQATPNLGFAAGLDVVLSKLTLKRDALAFETPNVPGTGSSDLVEAELEGSGDPAVGFTAGVMYRLGKLGLGAMYRHSITVKTDEGSVKFNIDPRFQPLFASAGITDQTIGAELGIPNYYVIGVYYMITDKLGVEADYSWYGWSVFDELTIEFENPALNQTIPENYVDEYQVRVGAHYELTEQFSLRAGYIYDRTPQPVESVSPLLPDDTRNDFTFGVGYKQGKFRIDGGYMWVNIGERSTVEDGVGKNDYGFNGTYTSHAHLFFLGLGYSL
ncbi:MAG: hypothetical protein EH225_01870 [Calditrichaeota bacterium]|nr:outer membrane protein transport protein [Calditrichota bacterium]RQW07431.1 MAG: hypothetical protein EH225_01870 [Calditrichota bacterium]